MLWLVCVYLTERSMGLSGCVKHCFVGQMFVVWDHRWKYFFFFLCVYILVCGSGCMWVFWHVSLNKSGTLLSCFQETFHEGLWYSPLPTPAPKWCSAFVANLCFSQLAASTRETEHILQTSMRNTLTKQATNSKHGYRNADNVSIFFSCLFPCLHRRKNYGICHCLSFCLGYVQLFCVNV